MDENEWIEREKTHVTSVFGEGTDTALLHKVLDTIKGAYVNRSVPEDITSIGQI